MKRILLLALTLPALAACSVSNDTGLADCTGNCEQTVEYKGYPLDCIVWDGSHGEMGMTCDFVKYHQENGVTN